jgi:hypothetical protein
MENRATVLETGEQASEMDLSILIVNWNSGNFLRRCLQSLEAQREEGVHFEVIVVDNASIDGSAEGLDKLFPWVKFIWNNYNYGFAKATNQAYRLSRGRYVMTLNPDTYLVPGSLKRIIEFLDTHSDAGAVQPYTTYVYITRWHTPYWWQRIRDMLNSPKASSLPSTPIQVDWFCGTCITVRRDLLPPDKFYEEWTFLFGEEYDFCKNIRQSGYKLYFLPFTIDHFEGGSRKRSHKTLCITHKLMQAALYMATAREFGPVQALFNGFLKVLDGLALWLGLSLIQLLHPKNERIPALIEWKALWTVNLGLLIMGESYFKKLNQKAEEAFNDQDFLREIINPTSLEQSS